MKRIDNILKIEYFKACVKKTAEYEKDRIYCLHDMPHAMDVARIAYIKALELKLGIRKDIIYAAALLHDTGRYAQYEGNAAHSEASADISDKVLPECGFTADEVNIIKTAISEHNTDGKKCSPLGEILRFADNKSRMCLWCTARDTCKWEKNEMNMEIEY